MRTFEVIDYAEFLKLGEDYKLSIADFLYSTAEDYFRGHPSSACADFAILSKRQTLPDAEELCDKFIELIENIEGFYSMESGWAAGDDLDKDELVNLLGAWVAKQKLTGFWSEDIIVDIQDVREAYFRGGGEDATNR